MDLAVEYVARAARQFPNFFATRDTIHFGDSPAGLVVGSIDGAFSPYEPIHAVSRSTATVLYLNGHETVDPAGNSEATAQGLTTHGEFGPILNTILIDAAHGTLTWSDFCCIAGQGNGGVFR